MRSFVRESRLNWLMTLKSAAALSLVALVASGCGDEHGFPDDFEHINEAHAGLDEETGNGGGSVSSVASSGAGPGVGGGGTSVSVGVGVGGSGSVGVGVGVGVGGGGGVGGDGGAGGGSGGPTAFWKFDDCHGGSNVLLDSSGNGADATRTASTTCGAGIDGSAVIFNGTNDFVQIPDQPLFDLDHDLAVAAWVKPNNVSGNQPIVQKRNNNNGNFSFSLAVVNGDAVMKITLANGVVKTSRAPIEPDVWTHVAGLYDGQFLFLFLNGEQVGQVSAAGTLKNVNGPVRIGRNTPEQRFRGRIDEVWLSTEPVDPSQLAALSCINRAPTLTVNPLTSGPVEPDTTVTYDVAITNNDVGACFPAAYFISTGGPPGFTVGVDPGFIDDVGSGETATFSLAVTGSSDADPGVHAIPFDIFDINDFVEPVSGQVTYELLEPTGCFVKTSRELLIRGVSVVDDPIRTTFDGPLNDPRTGAWTFGKLMEHMAPTPADAPAFATQLFGTWLTNQSINGHTVAARTQMQDLVLDFWPRNPDNTLDLTQSPLRLLAIVNRMDLRNLAAGSAGEGRFVFGVLGPGGFPMEFTVILEYLLPASTEADVLDWASSWHALGQLPFPSEQYNAALQAITTRFAGRNAAPGRPNGSALSQLRTNEIALDFPWELREFAVSQATGQLAPATVKLTPDLSFDQTPTLADFVNANEAAILTETHTVPEVFAGAPFLGGSSLNNLTAWRAPGIANNDARQRFSLNTCNGCHGVEETGTVFLHVFPREPGNEAALSGFLSGTTVPDPVSGEPRTFNDLGRRKVDLQGLVCAGPPAPQPAIGNAKSASKAANVGGSVSIAKGINRVH
jgi:Concanavalin A-like lectin/glucanases superfamily